MGQCLSTTMLQANRVLPQRVLSELLLFYFVCRFDSYLPRNLPYLLRRHLQPTVPQRVLHQHRTVSCRAAPLRYFRGSCSRTYKLSGNLSVFVLPRMFSPMLQYSYCSHSVPVVLSSGLPFILYSPVLRYRKGPDRSISSVLSQSSVPPTPQVKGQHR